MTLQGSEPKGRYVSFVAATLLAGTPLLSGCDALDSTPDAEYGGVCFDRATQNRIEDEHCGDWDDEGVYASEPGYHGYPQGTSLMWYPVTYGGHVPGIGQRTTGGMTKVPAGKPLAKGVPKAGATAQSGGMASIKRGGFGVKAGTSGGIGAKAGTGAVGGKSGGS